MPSEAESRTKWQGLKRKALVAWQGIKVEAPREDQVCRLTSQWNGRLRAAHSGAVHRRVRCQRLEVCARGVLRMGPRSSESAQGRAGIPREFSRPPSSPAPGGYSIEVLVFVRVSERARPEHKARACPGRGSALIQTEKSAGLIRAGSVGGKVHRRVKVRTLWNSSAWRSESARHRGVGSACKG